MMKPNVVKHVKSSGLNAHRDSNIELFRIISMFAIVAHHYVVNSGLTLLDGPIYSDILSWRSQFLLMFGAFGKTGINCFLLITGYFMCTSQITLKKYMKLLVEIMCYRWIIYVLFLITGYEPFSVKTLFKAIVPFTSIAQNFTGCFLMFFLCIPFLNIIIRHLNELQHIKLIAWCLITYVFFGTVPFFSVTMNYVSWYIVLYFIASYIRLYPKKIFANKRLWGWTALCSVLLSFLSVYACSLLCVLIDRTPSPYMFVADSNTLLACVVGISSFLYFLNVKIGYNRIINAIGATTFGVLLIHANSDTMRRWLWQDVLNNVEAYSSEWMILHAIGGVMAVFAICAVIDYLRLKYVEERTVNVVMHGIQGIADAYQKLEKRICDKLSIEAKERY